MLPRLLEPAVSDSVLAPSFGGAFFAISHTTNRGLFVLAMGFKPAPVFLDACACSSFFLLNPD
jgi:hypothetical protein